MFQDVTSEAVTAQQQADSAAGLNPARKQGDSHSSDHTTNHNPAHQAADLHPNQPRTRADISRANSKFSTGPRTPQGKAIASANSFRHGLCAQTFVLPPDEMEAFIHYSRDLATDLHVEGQLEMSLVQNMADAQFQIERANAIENNILQFGALDHTDASDPTRDFKHDHTTGLVITLKENIKTIDLISRYAARHNRAFLQNHARLREVQKDRRNGTQAPNRNHSERPTPDHAQTNQSPAKNPGFVPQPGSTGLQACEVPALTGVVITPGVSQGM